MRIPLVLTWFAGVMVAFSQDPALPDWNRGTPEPPAADVKPADAKGAEAKAPGAAKAADAKIAETPPAPGVLPGEGESVDGAESPEIVPADRELDGDLLVPNLVPESTLDAYFATRPGTFLVDPQNLLSGPPRDATAKLLDFHAEESVIDLFVYLYGQDQEIPTDVRTEELMERAFSSGRPAVVVFYYLGMPERSEMLLTTRVADEVPVYEQRRALQNSIQTAVQQQAPVEQLHAFINQMSIRIYWMERLPGIGGEKEKTVTPLLPVPAKVTKTAKAEWKEQLPLLAREYGARVGIGAAVLLVVVILVARWRSGLRYMLPEIDVEPRLGGPHAAGVGAVISFASSGTSPTTQRDQLPGYLRRR